MDTPPPKYSYPDKVSFHSVPSIQEIAEAERASVKKRGLSNYDKSQFRKAVTAIVRPDDEVCYASPSSSQEQQ